MDTASAYRHCLARARSHYENFPVASWVLPAPLRAPVAVIYAFARTADDLADEGDLTPQQRLAALDDYGARLDAAARGRPDDDPVFIALADLLRRYRLPVHLFHDLLTAFRWDVTRHRYRDFPELLDYCRHSANPVGRLLLHLWGEADPLNLAQSDAICTALQLINFYQDLEQDYHELGRIYLPQADMARHGVTEAHLRDRICDDALRNLLREQRERARELLRQGAPLPRRLPGRLGLELAFIHAGGLRVLDRLDENEHDPFARPRLGPGDWLRISARTLLGRLPRP